MNKGALDAGGGASGKVQELERRASMGKESEHGAGQTAGRGRPGADPTPSRCMAADVGGSSRQTASGLDDQRHQARLPSGLPSRPDRAEASKAEPLLGQRTP